MRPSTSPLRELVRKRDFYAGGLMVLLGLFIAIKGSSAYRLGSLMHMGPGFLPTALGVILVLIGIAIAAAAVPQTEDGVPADESLLPEKPEWWAWLCILASPVLFIVFGFYTGMAIGTFACVFIAALGDREVTFKSASLLALIVTGFGVTLFVRLLQVPLPVFTTFPLEIAAVFFAAALLSYFVFRPLVGSLINGLIVAIVIAAAYEGGLFFIPLTATFVFAGVLSYFAFRQASSELLGSFSVEIIPPVFAAANILTLLIRQVLPVSNTFSLILGCIAALAFAIGLYFPAATVKPAAQFERGTSTLLPVVFSAGAAALAAFCLLSQQMILSSGSPTLSYIAVVIAMLLIVVAVMWTGLYSPAAPSQPLVDAAAVKSRGLFRKADSPVPLALACAVTLWSFCCLLTRLVLAISLQDSLIVGFIIAAMYVLGVVFAPGTRTMVTDPSAATTRRLFPGGESYLPYLLALVFAVLAVEVSYTIDLFSNFLQRAVQ